MSKIYEALLRAELDRLGQQPESTTAVEEDVTSIPTDVALEPVFRSQIPQATVAAPASSRRPEKIAISVRRTTWSPDFKWLPSLLMHGPELEQLRSLRTHLYELRADKPLTSVLISSSLPQEGKSFVSVNLALTLASHKHSRVLLIDGDMRKHTLHNVLGCPDAPGLADYLHGRNELHEVMQETNPITSRPDLQTSRLESLTFISAGDEDGSAADLSGSKRLKELIDYASKHFEWVIVDSSPINLVSDAANMARVCDGVLLIARAGTTQIPLAQRAVNEFKGSNVLGFVLNGSTKANMSGYGYGYGYGYGNGYGNNKVEKQDEKA